MSGRVRSLRSSNHEGLFPGCAGPQPVGLETRGAHESHPPPELKTAARFPTRPIGSVKKALRRLFLFRAPRNHELDTCHSSPTQITRFVGGSMNAGTSSKGSRKVRAVKLLLLQSATAALVVACGGG